MGTNYYLRCKKPVEVRPTFHIAKRSYGWKPLFSAYPEREIWEENCSEEMSPQLEIRNFSDLREKALSDSYEIIDEYGSVYTWEEFCKQMKPYSSDETKRSHRDTDGLDVFIDDSGYEFTVKRFF